MYSNSKKKKYLGLTVNGLNVIVFVCVRERERNGSNIFLHAHCRESRMKRGNLINPQTRPSQILDTKKLFQSVLRGQDKYG